MGPLVLVLVRQHGEDLADWVAGTSLVGLLVAAVLYADFSEVAEIAMGLVRHLG